MTKCGLLILSRLLEDVNVGQIACHAVKIKALAYDKLGGIFKTDIIGIDVALHSLGFEQQRGHLDVGGLLFAEVVDEALDGIACVNNILDDDDAAVFNVLAKSQNFFNHAG